MCESDRRRFRVTFVKQPTCCLCVNCDIANRLCECVRNSPQKPMIIFRVLYISWTSLAYRTQQCQECHLPVGKRDVHIHICRENQLSVVAAVIGRSTIDQHTYDFDDFVAVIAVYVVCTVAFRYDDSPKRSLSDRDSPVEKKQVIFCYV